jgi:hypothetical protein
MQDPMAFASASSLSLGTSFLGSDPFTTLPLPESPVPSSSTPFSRHRHTASASSGPFHPPSPLAQAPLTHFLEPETSSKGKERAD